MLAQRLKAARLAEGLNQTEVGNALGVGQRFVSKLENGERRPSVETLAKLAKLYGVSETYLLGGEPAIKQGHSASGGNAGGSANGAIVNAGRSPPNGLEELEADRLLVEALAITPEEWTALRSIELPGPADKGGFIQLLATIRGITRR